MAEPEKTVNPDRRAESLTNYVDGNPLDVSLNDDTIWKDDLDPLKANQLVNSPSTLNDHPKKRSAFQITSVKPASQNENDGDSMDDLDESHTEEVSSLDWSKTDVDQDPSSEDTVSNVNIDEINNSNSNTNRPAEDVNQNEEKATTRFRVVKIESQKPFIRGRWKCFDFLDPPIEHQKTEHEKETGSGNSSAASSIHYVHGEDDPSKNPLGGTVFIQGDNQQMIVASPTRSMISMPGIQDPGKPQQPTQQHQQTYPAQNGSVPHASSVPQDYKPNQTVVTNVTNQSVTGQSVDFHHQQVQQPPATTASQNQFQASTGTGSPSSQHVVQSDGHSAQSVPQNVNHLQMGSSTSVSSGVRQVPGQQQHTIPTQPSSTPQQPLPVTTQAQSGQSSTEFRPTTPSDYAPGISASASQPAVLSQPTNPPTVNQPVQSAQMSHSSGATTQPAQVNPLQPHSVTRDSTPAPAGAAPSQTSDYSNIPVPVSNSISQPANSSVSTTSKLYEHDETKPSKPAAPAEPESALSVNTNAHVGTPSSRDSSDMSSVASVLMETLHGTMTIANISPQPGSPTGRVDATEGAEGVKRLAKRQPNLNALEASYTGSSTVAIDNKIEAAMDLVKSHLMFAVREEVEVLKEQIKGLIETNKQLQIENQALRQSSAPETVAAIPQTSPEEPPTSSS